METLRIVRGERHEPVGHTAPGSRDAPRERLWRMKAIGAHTCRKTRIAGDEKEQTQAARLRPQSSCKGGAVRRTIVTEDDARAFWQALHRRLRVAAGIVGHQPERRDRLHAPLFRGLRPGAQAD